MEAAAVGHQRRRPARLGLVLLLCSSLLLNAVFLLLHILQASRHSSASDTGGSCGLSWTLQAAKEAEAVAATECSGHGCVFLDGVVGEDGRPGCECNACFSGPDCSLRTPNCTADADRAVGNAVVGGKHIVFGAGSMQLINALVYALSPDANAAAAPPARVVAAAPYYPVRVVVTPTFRLQNADRDVRRPRVQLGRHHGCMGQQHVTELCHQRLHRVWHVANNPDGQLRRPVLDGSVVIYDHAYYWPHFTPIPGPADGEVMLFTMSKLSGHAGSRLGWALIKDAKVAKKVYDYVEANSFGASRDTQLRMLGIVKVMLANLHGEEAIFAFRHDVMRSRWRRLNAVVSRSPRVSLQKIRPQYCTYFKRVRQASPAYAWMKCEREEDEDCQEVLLKEKIITRSGVKNEANSRYTRMSLLKSDDDFDVLMERVTDLVNAENQEQES
ncbi:hypothetical protein EJB05_17192, partial [Eragrostis curvula]